MSIEALLEALKETIDRNTEALKAAAGNVGSTAATKTEKSEKSTKGAKTEKADEPKVTQDQMNAALVKIKDDFGMDEAKKVISEHGKAAKMSEIKPAQFQAVYDAAVARHAELSNGGSEDDGL